MPKGRSRVPRVFRVVAEDLDVRVGGPEAKGEGPALDGCGEEEVAQVPRGGPLLRGHPGSLEHGEGMVGPKGGLGVVDREVAPASLATGDRTWWP